MNLTTEIVQENRVHELQEAFRVFTSATATMEREYRLLQEHVEALRQELAEKNRALRASIERQRSLELQALRQSRLAAMGEMAATLAHEVRNPLGAMALFTRTLMEEISDRPEALRLARYVECSIGELNHLVNNILEYTRLPDPRFVGTDLRELIEDAVITARASMPDGVKVDLTGVVEAAWSVDRGLLMQALVNLLRNAGEAAGSGGRVQVCLVAGADNLKIQVADSGPGVPMGKEEAIFAPFFSTKEKGTGLGLAVSRAAVQAHEGTLTLVRSDEGAKFELRLPKISREAEKGIVDG